jgi:acetylornithine deacetylase/succinyl-diaminopimelate desuccinylase-like protein
MAIADQIRSLAERYADDTAANLARLVQTRSYGGEEGDVLAVIEELCTRYNFDEVRYDGLGNLLARVGNGSKSIAFDGHVDTVHIGDPSQWSRDPFSGEIADGSAARPRLLRPEGRRGKHDHRRQNSQGSWGTTASTPSISPSPSWRRTATACAGEYLIEEDGLKPDFIVSHRAHQLSPLPRTPRAHGDDGAASRASPPTVQCARARRERRLQGGQGGILAMQQLNEDLKPDDDNFLGKGTVVVSQIHVKGPSQCAVPDQAMLYLDRRLTWGEDAELAIEQVKKYMAEATGDREEEIEVTMPALHEARLAQRRLRAGTLLPDVEDPRAEHPLVQAGVAAYQNLYGNEPVVDKWTFSTNGVSICGLHKVPLIGFGPGDEDQAHAPNERLRVADLPVAVAFYASLVHTLP